MEEDILTQDRLDYLETVIHKQEIELDQLVLELNRASDKVDELDQFRYLVYELLDAFTIIIVPLKPETREAAKIWLLENVQGKYYVFPEDEFAFEHLTEAVRFKVTWGGQ